MIRLMPNDYLESIEKPFTPKPTFIMFWIKEKTRIIISVVKAPYGYGYAIAY
jgi:hypothetical protein